MEEEKICKNCGGFTSFKCIGEKYAELGCCIDGDFCAEYETCDSWFSREKEKKRILERNKNKTPS